MHPKRPMHILLVLALWLACGQWHPAQAQVSRTESVMRILPNGMRVVVTPRSYNKVLALNLFFVGGSADDPTDKHGLANLTQRLLVKGAGSRNAEQIAERIESVGGRIGVSTTEDYAELYTVTTAEDLDLALDLLADVALKPTFPEKEIERERELVLSGIRRRRDSQFGFTYAEFIRQMYPNHPYGHAVDGEEVPVRMIAREDIVAFHARRCQPVRLVLSACGDVDPEKLAQAVQKHFSKFPQVDLEPYTTAAVRPSPHFVKTTLRKQCKQAFVVTGFPALPLSDPMYPALRLANAMLGEGMSARLFRNLRDQQSLAYSVGSSAEAHKTSGHLSLWIGTNANQAEFARLSLLNEARLLVTQATDEEFERAKRYVLGKHLIARQSNNAKSHAVGMYEAMGVGFEYDEKFAQKIERVTKQQALEILAQFLTTPVSVTLLPEGFVEQEDPELLKRFVDAQQTPSTQPSL